MSSFQQQSGTQQQGFGTQQQGFGGQQQQGCGQQQGQQQGCGSGQQQQCGPFCNSWQPQQQQQSQMQSCGPMCQQSKMCGPMCGPMCGGQQQQGQMGMYGGSQMSMGGPCGPMCGPMCGPQSQMQMCGPMCMMGPMGMGPQGGMQMGQEPGTLGACDITETQEAHIVSTDVPGMTAKDVKVQVMGNTLSISGERRRDHEQHTNRMHRTERSFGRFQRSFPLPPDADQARITASVDHGILHVYVPKIQGTNVQPMQGSGAGSDVKVKSSA